LAIIIFKYYCIYKKSYISLIFKNNKEMRKVIKELKEKFGECIINYSLLFYAIDKLD